MFVYVLISFQAAVVTVSRIKCYTHCHNPVILHGVCCPSCAGKNKRLYICLSLLFHSSTLNREIFTLGNAKLVPTRKRGYDDTAVRYTKRKEKIFVAASHQTGLDTKSMTRRSIQVGIRGREGHARAEARTLLNYARHRPT